jgi:hypothetical protein
MTMYDDVMRTIIDLTAGHLESLDRWRKREGVSRAEAIRRAVSAFVESHAKADAGHAFGLWRRRPEDGLKYQAKVRAEWSDARPARRGR